MITAEPVKSRLAMVTRAMVLWCVLAGIVVALTGPLRVAAPGPTALTRDGVTDLVDRFGPSAPLLWLIRVGATASALVLAALLAVGLLARVLGAISAARLIDRLSPAIVRRALGPITAASLSGVVTVAGAGTSFAAGPPPPPLAVMVVAAPLTSIAPENTTVTVNVPTTVVPTTTRTPTSAVITSTVPGSAASAAPSMTNAVAATVAVASGDSFWSIAASTLEQRLARTPSNQEVAVYWRELIDANRDRLRVPGDPGLIFPGQHLVVP